MKNLPKITAIIVAYNEELMIEQIISELKKQNYNGEVEYILADGGSNDQTVELAKKHHLSIVLSKQKGKAVQMNTAAQAATGDVLFFVHADMQFPNNTFTSIIDVITQGYAGGGFANVFDSQNEKIKNLGNLLNLRFLDKREQSDKGVFYGDNAIFVLKDAFHTLGGFKEIPIMEDFDFSKRLSKKYKTFKIREPQIIVSSRRHIKAGFIKTRLQWVFIRIFFQWGVSPFLLAKWYKDIR
ncbi:glycosyltransferase [Tenacibaculum amylolyticum]|uniref:glycosyltransferase n=1 Tax=Tenacibaculum amylolyticum TaxID=104269 RepID=UPI003893190C